MTGLDNNLSYDVRIWSISAYEGKARKTYTVRWLVAGQKFPQTFATSKLAESFQAELTTAARKGIPFNTVTGLPQTMMRSENSRTWFEHAAAFVDSKWPHASARHRKNIAEALANVTLAVLPAHQSQEHVRLARLALRTWAFNKSARGGLSVTDAEAPSVLKETLRWVADKSPGLNEFKNATVLRRALDSLALKLDGKAAAPATVARKRSAFYSALEYAVELELFEANPIDRVQWTTPEHTDDIDRRVVANPAQVEALLAAVREIYPALEAFFGCLYYSALRPSEAARLDKYACLLPETDDEWGELLLSGSTQHAGSAWTDSGEAREDRSLKHRALRDTRPVPVPPELVALIRRHIAEFGTGPDGRLFVSRTGRFGRPLPAAYCNSVSSNTYTRAWQRAREAALSTAQCASLLAKRPYDLRHAGVSLWLNAGVPATQVAEWAGHSVNVLLRVYAKCIDGQDEAAKRRIETALRAHRQEEQDQKGA